MLQSRALICYIPWIQKLRIGSLGVQSSKNHSIGYAKPVCQWQWCTFVKVIMCPNNRNQVCYTTKRIYLNMRLIRFMMVSKHCLRCWLCSENLQAKVAGVDLLLIWKQLMPETGYFKLDLIGSLRTHKSKVLVSHISKMASLWSKRCPH